MARLSDRPWEEWILLLGIVIAIFYLVQTFLVYTPGAEKPLDVTIPTSTTWIVNIFTILIFAGITMLAIFIWKLLGAREFSSKQALTIFFIAVLAWLAWDNIIVKLLAGQNLVTANTFTAIFTKKAGLLLP